MAIGGVSDKFSETERWEVNNYGQIIIANCRQRRKLFIPKSRYTAVERRSVQ